MIVTEEPRDESHAPLLVDPVHARPVRARDVVEGDLILASFCIPKSGMQRADYFNDQYEAHPQPFKPECQCGVCELAERDVPHVVLTDGYPSGPWETCDPWPADDFTLIIPAARLA
ncbi:hypothetical protein HUT18_18390 [Streptomyces sp. NA04227]|nr:hypothetical protein HUT18_18390 [Streptomyces sp. NA04227]